jgi:hypothetical protein
LTSGIVPWGSSAGKSYIKNTNFVGITTKIQYRPKTTSLVEDSPDDYSSHHGYTQEAVIQTQQQQNQQLPTDTSRPHILPPTSHLMFNNPSTEDIQQQKQPHMLMMTN